MSNKITTVILDWAGTTVDFGCFAPVEAFVKAFEAHGVTPTTAETRLPMGMAKREHIRTMLAQERLGALWKEKHGRPFNEEDVDAIYACFEPELFSVLSEHASVIPGVVSTVGALREAGLRIGSTTGYNREMMRIVAEVASAQGYAPDTIVCPEEAAGAGRPAPYMLWRNLELLGCGSIAEAIKVGDTLADIQEGKNAGCISVGVIAGSSELGLSAAEYAALSNSKREVSFQWVRERYASAGADYVLDEIAELPALIERIDGAARRQEA